MAVRRYDVTLVNIARRETTVTVEASNPEDARAKAFGMGADVDWDDACRVARRAIVRRAAKSE